MGSDESLWTIFINAMLVNNFVLSLFLGLCSYLGVSARYNTALPMGIAVTFVMVVGSLCAYALNLILIYFDLEFLRLISYIVVIASTVQLVEMVMKKYVPAVFRALGIYLPLIATNCVVLAPPLFQTARGYDLVQSLVFSFGAGCGYILAIVLLAGLRERLQLANVPALAQGGALTVILAGFLSLAFMGFAGLGG
ncbi:electron transporter RnfA [Sulfuricaulis limicola]|uniref:Electron transporter RnfA n=1 Tax=Sulfuricaulis limicola TaxID=1620215 RepID=A0A1B4XJA6_9GAMM|nr:Rnf-Nqr domain containing protein [Sulfuricaulis limicola]BAV34888.1 electron transporter RnfA [Sulfuricaulis limicola]